MELENIAELLKNNGSEKTYGLREAIDVAEALRREVSFHLYKQEVDQSMVTGQTPLNELVGEAAAIHIVFTTTNWLHALTETPDNFTLVSNVDLSTKTLRVSRELSGIGRIVGDKVQWLDSPNERKEFGAGSKVKLLPWYFIEPLIRGGYNITSGVLSVGNQYAIEGNLKKLERLMGLNDD